MNAPPIDAPRNNFDFLRLFASALVLYSHTFAIAALGGAEPVLQFTGFETGGGFAVPMFFVLSGFLVAGSWDRCSGVFDFLRRRALRLFPGLAGAVLFSILVIGPLFTTLDVRSYFAAEGTWRYAYNILLLTQYELPGVFAGLPLPNVVNGSLWTLPTEAVMYLALPLLYPLARRFDAGPALLYAVFFIVFLQTKTHPALSGAMLFEFTSWGMIGKLGTFFFAGVFWHRLQHLPVWRLDAFLVAAFVLWGSFHTAYGTIALALCLPYITLYLGHARLGPLARVGRYGDFSYGLYLYAFPVQQVVMALVGLQFGFWPALALMFAGTFVLAVLSWRLVEQPALRWKQRRGARPAPAATAAAAAPAAA